MKSGIAVAGTILVDSINEISAYPEKGELTKIHSVEKAVGGCVPNVAIDLKRLSPSLPVKAIGKIGDDENGSYVSRTLEENGVDVSLVTKAQDKTSFTEVMSVVGGQRTFFTYAGASSLFGKEDVDFDLLDARMLHLGYFLLLDKVDGGDGLRILQEATLRGIKTSIDLVSENSNRYSLVLPCLPYVDNLIINEAEAGSLCGILPTKENLFQIAKTLKDMGVRERVIIHTPEGSLCQSDSGRTLLGALSLPNGYIQGTTGAGDAFCAGALLGIYEGASDEDILKIATVAATGALSTKDATSGLTALATLKERFASFSYNGAWL